MDSEKEALINAVEMAIDWGVDVSENDMKLYNSYIEERKNNMGKNVTVKYGRMLSAFSEDFDLVLKGKYKLTDLQDKIDNKNEVLMYDIELLSELAWLIRNNKVIIKEI